MRAASLVADLKRAGVDAEMAEGAKSQFDVVAGGTTVFSKQREGRYPDAAEVLALLGVSS